MCEHFFIVGAQRSGTTYLYHLLDEHPDIEMARPMSPEPKFFMNTPQYEKGIASYTTQFFTKEFRGLFRGEKSTSYIESEVAAQRIAAYFPEAPIIFILRDPIKRAISNYWFTVNNGLETLSMAQAFMAEKRQYDHARFSVSPYAYLARGRYLDYITIYERYFAPEQLVVLLFEQIVGSIEHIQSLFARLGVDYNFIPTVLQQRVNAADKQDGPISPELAIYLNKYFSESNSLLATRFGLDISLWS